MSETRLAVMEGITSKLAVTAYYNGGLIKLAPHLLFERHGGLYVHAENLSKASRPDSERRLGQFKLEGLVAARLLDESFDPLPRYAPIAPQPDDIVILTI